ncbi:MAG: hypothetical protein WD467_01120 [Candidatus Saccharimonadales bacterium]
MYLHDRQEAGRLLAASLVEKYRFEDTVILALSPGGVVVGYEIAKALHARLSLLLTEPIPMPGVAESEVIGLIDQEGHFTYNSMIPTGLLTELVSEMHSYIESEKLLKLHKLSRIMNEEGLIDPSQFYGHHVIIVSDGFKNGLSFDAAVNYLKPINTGKLIAVAPNASVRAIDRLHIAADEIYVSDVVANYLDTDHYFEDNTLPDIQQLMNEIIHKWE